MWPGKDPMRDYLLLKYVQTFLLFGALIAIAVAISRVGQ